MTEPSEYTVDELMCALMSRQIESKDWISHGAVVPLAGAALMLAKHTHAKDLDFFYLGTVFNSINPSESDLSKLMTRPELAYKTSRALISHHDIINHTLRGKTGFQFLRPIQIDGHGSVNVSMVGDPEAPKYRFHGIAVADAMILVQRACLYVTEHNVRVFPEELTFRTGAGHVDGGKWRASIDAPGMGPQTVVTPLCVFDFETENGTARLRSLHRGVTVDEVRAATGFDFEVPAEVPFSEPPSELELQVLREVVDPMDTRKLEFKEWRAEVQSRLLEAGAN